MSDTHAPLSKRASTWKLQEYADDALVIDSQYPYDVFHTILVTHMLIFLLCSGSRFIDFTGVVYPERPGKDVWVYVLGLGIQIKVSNVSMSLN